MTSPEYQKLQLAFQGVLEDIVRFRGTEPMQTRIYSIIALSTKPLTQEAISEKTGYSRSQISRYLSVLEQRGMIKKESQPGSRTQLYGGSTRPFFDQFKNGIDISERFVSSRLNVIESIHEELNRLPDEERNSEETKRLHEVVTVFDAWFSSYLELLSDFNASFREKMDELERDLFPL